MESVSNPKTDSVEYQLFLNTTGIEGIIDSGIKIHCDKNSGIKIHCDKDSGIVIGPSLAF